MPVLHLDMQNLSRVNSAMEELGNTFNKIYFYDICDESNACLTIDRPLSLTLSCEQANSCVLLSQTYVSLLLSIRIS